MSQNPQSALTRDLRALLDSDQLLLDADAQAPFLKEWRGRYQSSCIAVALPENVEQVAAIVQACREHAVAVVTQGGNTGLCGGAVSSDGDLLVNLKRMDRIRTVDATENSIEVEAGCSLLALQQAAARAERYFPVNIVPRERAQVGGLISTNAGGTNVLRYGNMRQQVLGLEVVLADGHIWRNMRGLQKDNSGYDLKQLFIGAEGTLGIITAARLRLHPQPAGNLTALVGVPDIEAALDLFVSLRRQGAGLSSCELFPRFAIDLVLRHGQGVSEPLEAEFAWHLLLEFEYFTPADVEPESATMSLREACVPPEHFTVARNAEEAAGLWALRKQIPAAQSVEGVSFKHDISVPLSAIPEMVRRGEKLVSEIVPAARLCVFGHLGDGNLHFNISQPQDMSPIGFREREEQVKRAVHDLVDELGGSFAAEHGIGRLKVDELRRYKSDVEVNLMRRIKQSLDPDRRLNPGKVVDPD